MTEHTPFEPLRAQETNSAWPEAPPPASEVPQVTIVGEDEPGIAADEKSKPAVDTSLVEPADDWGVPGKTADASRTIIQSIESGPAQEILPAEKVHKTERFANFEQAREADTYLAERGEGVLGELPQNVHPADQEKFDEALADVKRFVDTAGSDHRAAGLSRNCHPYEVASVGSLDEARGLLTKYDHLHPSEGPEDRARRQGRLVEEWVDVQVAREHRREDMRLAPEVSAEDCKLPDGFRPAVVESHAVAVEYSDPSEILPDIARYQATVSPYPEDWAADIDTLLRRQEVTIKGGSLSVGSFRVSDSGYSVHTLARDGACGIRPIERYAHIVGKEPVYSNRFSVAVSCPMPRTTQYGLEARVSVPFDQIANVLASVTGQPQIKEITPGEHIKTNFNFPGGKLQFSGDFDTNGSLQPHSSYRGGQVVAPTFSVELKLERDTSNAVRQDVAKRLSAWIAASARQR